MDDAKAASIKDRPIFIKNCEYYDLFAMEKDLDKVRLREQAKKRLDDHGPAPKRSASAKLVEELSIHQEELNIQNEELRRIQIELEATKARYFELYDLAPVGYIILNNDLIIKESNLAASTLLGMERKDLINKGISKFISPRSHESPFLHYHRLAQGYGKQVSTFLVRGENEKELPVQFESNLVENGPEKGYRSVLTDVTELKKTKEALTEGEIKYRSLFDSIDEGFCTIEVIFDEKGKPIDYRFLEINAAFERQTGINDAVGKRMREIEPRHEEHWFEIYGTIAKTGESKRFTQEAKALIDGWYEVYAFKIGGSDSNKVAILFNDITERKRLEESLKKVNESLELKVQERTKDLSERKHELETIMDAVPAIIWISRNGDSSDMMGNKEVEKLLGMPSGSNVSRTAPEDQRPEHFLAYRDDKVIPEDELPMQKAGLTGKPVIGTEFEFRFDDGHSVWVYGNAVPLKDESGSTRGVIGAFVDITERRNAEIALRESEQRLRSHVENTPMAVVEWDSDFIVTRWAGEAERMFGWSVTEVLGRPIMALNLIYEPDIPMVQVTMGKLTDGVSKKVVSTNRNITKDGRIITCTWYNSVLIDDQGKTISVLSLVLDITAQIEAEKDLKRFAEKLAASNSELQQFAYVASHDLQEPLRMVTAYLGLLEKKFGDQLDGTAKEYMDIAIDGGLRARALISDLLEFSRIDSQAKESHSTNMEEVFSKTMENLSIRIKEENALISHDPLPSILADDTQMLQVMQNLLGNAIKFHGTEPPMVHISYKDNGTEWCFSIQDNGIGIDPEYGDKIFVLFQRLHNRDKYEGTGIGLAITKKIVERHGGKIWVESQEGKGATFFFTIPKSAGNK